MITNSTFKNTLFKIALTLLFALSPFGLLTAQEAANTSQEQAIQLAKDSITRIERERLKTKIQHINRLFRKKEISLRVADSLKLEAAETHAKQIQKKYEVIAEQAALLHENPLHKAPNPLKEYLNANVPFHQLPNNEYDLDTVLWRFDKYHYKHRFTNKRNKRFHRTSSDLVLGIGLNNTYAEAIPIEESNYQYLGSRFFELGWSWTSMIFRHSDFLRIRYGASLQFNGLKPTDNRYFVLQNATVQLKPFSQPLAKSKLNITNLIFPVHLEFGNRYSSRTRTWNDNETNVRYTVSHRYSDPIIFGFGAYGGFNLKATQKLKYELDGKRKKEKRNDNLNITQLLYGLSAYIAFNEVALYAKYELTPLFKDPLFQEQNIALGVRFDIR